MYTLIISGWTARETPLFLIKRTFYWNPTNCPLGERWCFPLDWRDLPYCLSVFASGTTKGKIMPLCWGKLGHEKGDLFSCIARGEFTVWRPIHLHVKTRRCLGLVLKFTDNYVKLLKCYSEISAWFNHAGNFPPYGLWIGSITTVSISTDPGNIYRYKLRLEDPCWLSFLRILRKCK